MLVIHLQNVDNVHHKHKKYKICILKKKHVNAMIKT